MIQANRNVAIFNTIIAIVQNDQSKIKLIIKYENTRKTIINNECAILFNKTCIYIYIYIYTEWPKKKCPLFFEHLYLPFKLRCFKFVCFRRSINLCYCYCLLFFEISTDGFNIKIRTNGELSKGKNTTAHKSFFLSLELFWYKFKSSFRQ